MRGKRIDMPSINRHGIVHNVRLRSGLKTAYIKRNVALYVLLLPAILCFLLFRYVPLYGLIIAFKNYYPMKGILGSAWAGMGGFQHFITFFESGYFYRLLSNTFLLSFFCLLAGFPMPILMAVILNELKANKARNVYQTFSYIPYFISLVVVVSFIRIFAKMDTGLLNVLLVKMNMPQQMFLTDPKWFRTVYVVSGIWQTMGWNSILYYAALRNVDPNIIEAAEIDGCNRFQRIRHISLPSILTTIMTLLLLNIGNLMSVGYEKVYLLYSPSVYSTADVLSTYTYRSAFESNRFSFASAVGLFESVTRFALLITANTCSRRLTGESLW